MRFDLQKPADNQRRRRHGFLWLPRTAEYQRRWLEWSMWEERYDRVRDRWCTWRWISLEEYYCNAMEKKTNSC